MKRKDYESELEKLQAELVQLQASVRHSQDGSTFRSSIEGSKRYRDVIERRSS